MRKIILIGLILLFVCWSVNAKGGTGKVTVTQAKNE